MFGQKPIEGLDISRSKLKKIISSSTGCSKKAAEKRIDAVVENGGSLKYCLDNGLFELTAGDLSRFFTNASLRVYVEDLSSEKNVPIVDVYKQMRRAKKEFGVSYPSFVKFNLLGSSDAVLRKRSKIQDKRRDDTIKNIASAMNISFDEALDETARIKEKFSISPSAFYRKRLYGKTDSEIEEILSKERKHKKESIKKIAREKNWTEEEAKNDIDRCHAKFGIPVDDYFMLGCHKLDDDTLATYGNIRDSTTMNRHYNARSAVGLLSNKKLFDEYFNDFIKRKHWVNRDTDFEEFSAFAEGLSEAFCKPIDGSLGRAVEVVDFTGRDLKSLYDELMAKPKLIFEERVSQHHELDEFYDKSVNTVRLFTILDDDEFFVFASFIRFGANGSLADNVAAGGVGCGIDVDTGTICTPAMDHDGNFLEEHPNSHKKFVGFRIPRWDEALEITEKALRKNPDLNYIGWDVAIREDDVVLIEGNSRPDIGICQSFFNYSKIGIKPFYERFLEKSSLKDATGD